MRIVDSIILGSVLIVSGSMSVQAAMPLQIITHDPLPACTVQDCGPAPMIKTTYCPDGSVAGRAVCERQTGGSCGYSIKSSCTLSSASSQASCVMNMMCIRGTHGVCVEGRQKCVADVSSDADSSSVSSQRKPPCTATIRCVSSTRPICRGGKPRCVPFLPVESSVSSSSHTCVINIMCVRGKKAVCGTNGKPMCV